MAVRCWKLERIFFFPRENDVEPERTKTHTDHVLGQYTFKTGTDEMGLLKRYRIQHCWKGMSQVSHTPQKEWR